MNTDKQTALIIRPVNLYMTWGMPHWKMVLNPMKAGKYK